MASIRNACWAFAPFSGHVLRKSTWQTSAGRTYPNLNQGVDVRGGERCRGVNIWAVHRVDESTCALHTHNRLTAFVPGQPG